MKLPQIIDKTEEEIATIIKAINESALSDGIKIFVIKCIELAVWFPLQLKNKTISLSRLRKMIFGKGYYSTSKKRQSTVGSGNEESSEAFEQDCKKTSQPPEDGNLENNQSPEKKKPGHGRMSHNVYQNYTQINLIINGIKIGDSCPEVCGGTLRYYSPGILVRIHGQNFADVKKYSIEKLRCDLCGHLVSAEVPPEVGNEKYDASFKAMLAIQKYYAGMPFYRQEYVQRLLGFPLPDSTQWDLIEQIGSSCYPPFNVLKEYAGNGQNVYNDDTKARIQEVIKELKANPNAERKGMFTTGIIAEYEGHKIALFLNGTKHAGENLADILKHRKPDKSPVIQMCDALNNNLPGEFVTILCNCLSHGFRKFEELADFFPNECLTVMKKISQVYEYDAKTKGMTKEKRLEYHQKHSRPVMDELINYINKLLDEHLVEPNNDLGKSLRYMKKHWEKLTRFLTVAGAPLDNNIVERALKIAIRNRKAAMFYRTRYSAQIGGMITSLIYTGHLAGKNAHHYLTVLQQYKHHVATCPKQWLPWNYEETLLQLKTGTGIDGNPQRCSSSDYSAAA